MSATTYIFGFPVVYDETFPYYSSTIKEIKFADWKLWECVPHAFTKRQYKKLMKLAKQGEILDMQRLMLKYIGE